MVYLTFLFNHCFGLSYFASSWTDVPKSGKDPK